MQNNQIILDNNKINDIAKQFAMNSSDSMDARSQVTRDFSNVRNSGMLTNTINSTENQMSNLSDAYRNAQNTISKLIDEFDFDKEASNKINEIEIPQDFVTNNSMKSNYYDTFMLSKLDGKSVNNGQATEKASDKSSISSEEKLVNINKDETQAKEFKDIYDVQNEELKNINQGQEATEQVYDSSSLISQEEKLKSISQEQETEKQEYDSSSTISRAEALNNIVKDAGSVSDYDSSSTIETKVLDNINNAQTP